jgi:hypothetical protein
MHTSYSNPAFLQNSNTLGLSFATMQGMDMDKHIGAPHFDGDTAFTAVGQGELTGLQRGGASIPAGLVA